MASAADIRWCATVSLPRFTVLSADNLRQLHEFFFNWAKLLARVLVPGGNVVVATNPLLSYIVSGALAGAGLERRGEIVRLVMTMRGGDRPKGAHEEFSDVSVMPRSMWNRGCYSGGRSRDAFRTTYGAGGSEASGDRRRGIPSGM